jgi:hypothetical protein
MEKVIFSEAEKEIIENLQETMGLSIFEATDHVVKYKRNLALYHEQKGNFALAEHLLKELGEWDESRRDMQKATYQDIINP